MKTELWKKQKACYQRELSLEDLPLESNVIYCAANNMSPLHGGSVFFTAGAGDGDYSSDDVVVVGDEASQCFLLAGAISCRRSMSYFTVVRRNNRTQSLLVKQPDIAPDEEPEKVVILRGNHWGTLLEQYACMTAKESNAPEKIPTTPLRGYCSWYYHFSSITEEIFLQSVAASGADGSAIAGGIAQIDSGYQKFHGDWFSRKDSWPHPLDEVAEKIRARGMTPGIWLAPLIASEGSNLFRAHPGWFVSDRNGNPVAHAGWDGGLNHLWYCLDGSCPEVLDHLRFVFRKMWKCGFRYFKLDALGYGLAVGVRQDRKATAVSAFRAMLGAIREAVPEAYLLGCSAPFLPLIGLVNGCRVGCDTGLNWDLDKKIPKNAERHPGRPGIRNAWHDLIANWWMIDRYFRCDPDCVMLRDKSIETTEGEARISALGAIFTGVCITSDHVAEMSEPRRNLLNFAAKFRIYEVHPEDWHADIWPHVFSGKQSDGRKALAFVNDCEEPLLFRPGDYGLSEWEEVLAGIGQCGNLTVPPHDARIVVQKA
ncbi:MAG: alpha-galactosidase [Victivallaceae bacterium]|nr:alpha-galactosidase [Victivallaceae bacterium]